MRRLRLLSVIGLGLLVVGAIVGAVGASGRTRHLKHAVLHRAAVAHPRLAVRGGKRPRLVGAATHGGHVIVLLKKKNADVSLARGLGRRRAVDRAQQAPIVTNIRRFGGSRVRQLTLVNAVAADVSAKEAHRLSKLSSVAQVIPDKTLTQTVPIPKTVAASDVAAPQQQVCPSDPGQPLVEPEALQTMQYEGSAPDEGDTIADGSGVTVAIEGMNEIAGNPNFTRPDGSHVVIDAPDYTANDSNDEDYGDVSSIAAQGTVVYQYSEALPYSDVPAGCSFVIRGDAPGASVVDLSQVDTPVLLLSQVLAGIDAAATTVHADVISESFGSSSLPNSTSGQLLAKANEAAVEAGVTVVESSGDSGDSGTMIAAADDPLVIAAGAVDNFRLVALAHDYRSYVSNNMAALSSGGTAPTNKVVDLVAPGYFGGEAACADGSGGCPPNYPTESMRGTSESAPLIAGAAADVIQAYRGTHGGASPTPATVKEVLTSTATDIDSPADQQGSGLLNVYAAVKAAQQMPGTTDAGGPGHSPGLVASPSQLDLVGNGGSVSDQTVSLYNTNSAPTTVAARYRRIGPEFQLGRVVTENVSAPPASQPIPPEGAQAASPVSFVVPPGLNRLDADMIWPDPTNSNIICFALFDPKGQLVQLSYDDGSPAANGRPGSVSNIQHAEVTNPEPGRWTAKILWSGKDVDLALAPAVPGTYTGPMSFKVSGQNYISSPASGPVTIGAHSSASVRLRIAMPVSPGDNSESVQFSARDGAATSLPVTRRTLIPANGGPFQTLITSTVGRMIGQLNTYQINVPAGRTELDATFRTADASADNDYTFYLVNPSGTVVSEATSPQTVNGTAVGTAEIDAASPVAGTWTIDVELNLTVSGKEFTQTVYGNVQDP